MITLTESLFWYNFPFLYTLLIILGSFVVVSFLVFLGFYLFDNDWEGLGVSIIITSVIAFLVVFIGIFAMQGIAKHNYTIKETTLSSSYYTLIDKTIDGEYKVSGEFHRGNGSIRSEDGKYYIFKLEKFGDIPVSQDIYYKYNIGDTCSLNYVDYVKTVEGTEVSEHWQEYIVK